MLLDDLVGVGRAVVGACLCAGGEAGDAEVVVCAGGVGTAYPDLWGGGVLELAGVMCIYMCVYVCMCVCVCIFFWGGSFFYFLGGRGSTVNVISLLQASQW